MVQIPARRDQAEEPGTPVRVPTIYTTEGAHTSCTAGVALPILAGGKPLLIEHFPRHPPPVFATSFIPVPGTDFRTASKPLGAADVGAFSFPTTGLAVMALSVQQSDRT